MVGLSSSPSQWSRPQDLSSCSMRPELSYWRGSFHSIESSSQAPARGTSDLRPPPQSGAPSSPSPPAMPRMGHGLSPRLLGFHASHGGAETGSEIFSNQSYFSSSTRS